MIVTEAYWEKRNLGIDVTEIEVEPGDKTEVLDEYLSRDSSKYIVVKVSTRNSDFLFHMSKIGFVFVEVLNKCSYEGDIPKLSGTVGRLANLVKCSEMDMLDYQNMKSQVAQGMFHTDRIALDPFFGLEMSAKRYFGWIEDEGVAGAKLYSLSYKDKSVGFFTLLLKDTGVFCNIGGIYPNFMGFGFGILLNYFEIVMGKSLGGNKIITAYSSNNLDAHNIHQTLGFSIKNQYYVYVRHAKNCT